MVTDFSAAERARGVKFCMHVGLLSGQVFSHFGEIWPRGGSPSCPRSVYAEVTWEKISPSKKHLQRGSLAAMALPDIRN